MKLQYKSENIYKIKIDNHLNVRGLGFMYV
jgi:hypothetical protein